MNFGFLEAELLSEAVLEPVLNFLLFDLLVGCWLLAAIEALVQASEVRFEGFGCKRVITEKKKRGGG